MKRFSIVRPSIRPCAICAVLVLSVCGLIACQTPASTNGASSASLSGTRSATIRPESQLTGGPTRDLTRDEAQGGHILRKHVGQTEEQLRERLERERNITGASTYADLPTAERAVGAAIAQSQSQIQNWLSQPGRRTNLVLDYDSDVPLGRTMNRGEHQSRVCEHAVVVLKYNGPNHYYVLTSYPECRS